MSSRRLYVFTYDIANDRRRYRISRLLEKQGVRVQESVFEIRGTQAHADRLASRIKRMMMPEDSLRVYPVPTRMLPYCIAHGGAPVAEAGEFFLF